MLKTTVNLKTIILERPQEFLHRLYTQSYWKMMEWSSNNTIKTPGLVCFFFNIVSVHNATKISCLALKWSCSTTHIRFPSEQFLFQVRGFPANIWSKCKNRDSQVFSSGLQYLPSASSKYPACFRVLSRAYLQRAAAAGAGIPQMSVVLWKVTLNPHLRISDSWTDERNWVFFLISMEFWWTER